MNKLNPLLSLLLLINLCILSGCGSGDDGSTSLNAPDQTLTVQEDIESGDLIGEIQVDHAQTSSLSFNILSGNDAEIFDMSNDGKISLADGISLDYEETDSYELTVEISDDVSSDETIVTINVSDVDETGILILNGITYEFGDEGILLDEGASDPFDNGNNTHFVYNFSFAEGDLTQDEENEEDFEFTNITLLFATELYSPGTESFNLGTFEHASGDATAEELDGKYFFRELAFAIDGNNNGTTLTNEDDVEKDIIYLATSGTVEVSSTEGNTYKLVFDITISQIDFDPELNWLYENDIVPNTERHMRFTYDAPFKVVSGDTSEEVEDDDLN
ncbi:Cadherin domain-containing protein [Reichenbachiella agariperforans]|uniref:Cadherin domain-containing protein n=1 Tax=Reichenbachiella agariperforans TaxID=156994 RepID=A0A1M6Q1F3_REIAG|nr:cadherin repeat domain-containing protein [Reichenbachiella agariperforans]SHK14060.1 Cadherin domain-containing protein [Reichenbachiella agariperforans]